jgi:hypothetical protein
LKQIIHNQYCLQEVPEEKDRFADYYFAGTDNKLYANYGQIDIPMADLPKGEWGFVCEAKYATEEQAKGIVENVAHPEADICIYEDYEGNGNAYADPVESLKSLILSHGMKVTEVLILKKD